MISFGCPKCGKRYALADSFVGKRAKCSCGAELTVPAKSEPLTPPTSHPAGGAWRVRRLTSDQRELAARFTADKPIRLQYSEGSPPSAHVIEFEIDSLDHGPHGPVPRRLHRMRVELTGEYPRTPPRCKMLTDIFHPNIDRNGICIGDHWTAGERLSDLIIRVAEMIAFQSYNIRSPLDADAAEWADLNASQLPIDNRDFAMLCPMPE